MPSSPDVREPRRCNPLIIHPKGDTPGWDTHHRGRYEVYCGACGPEASVFAFDFQEARTFAGQHRPNPGGVGFSSPVEHDDRLRDWSESTLRGMPDG